MAHIEFRVMDNKAAIRLIKEIRNRIEIEIAKIENEESKRDKE
jgi:hypothetical protein